MLVYFSTFSFYLCFRYVLLLGQERELDEHIDNFFSDASFVIKSLTITHKMAKLMNCNYDE